MNSHITRVLTAVAAGAALSTAGVTGASASAWAAQAEQPARASLSGISGAAAAPGTQLWAERYDGYNRNDDASSVAVSPHGGRVFVTGDSQGATSQEDYATIAYSAATGAQLWVSRYNGPGNKGDYATSAAVSPDGRTVFVTGTSRGATSAEDYATVAYDAATGAKLWARRYNGHANRSDYAAALALSPDGRKVFVTGSSVRASQKLAYATVAYDAGTGAKLWARRYSRPLTENFAAAVAVSPDASKVFVTGRSAGATSGLDYATVAYDAATGAKLWARRYNGPANGDDLARSVAVSPGGRKVYVTGYSAGAASSEDYATVAYTAATGARLWARRYNGPGNGLDGAYSVAVSPGGGKVFVTGSSAGATSGADYATVAYRAVTGARLWATRYDGSGSGFDEAYSAAVSPDGAKVFVTGESTGGTSAPGYATVAYRAATGAQLWASRYNGPLGGGAAAAVTVSPGGGKVFVTGYNFGTISGPDYATIAYHS
jgi:WD40 repeat protein